MRAVIQRVTSAKVTVDDRQSGAIDEGLLVLLGVHKDDEPKDITWLADKIIHLRIFEDEDGKMNLSLKDTGGSYPLQKPGYQKFFRRNRQQSAEIEMK